MKETKRLRFIYGGKKYHLTIKYIKFSKIFIISKLQIGYGYHWLIYQQGSWFFIGDISLCSGLQLIIISKIAEIKDFVAIGNGKLKLTKPYKDNVIVSAILNKLVRADRLNYHDK